MLFRPAKTQKLADNLYAVGSMTVNFYIYDTGKNLIVFDAGVNARMVEKGFKKLGLSTDKVSHVFLTHSDYDHAGGVSAFKNAAVYFSKEEIPMISGEKSRAFSFVYNKRIKNITPLEDRRTIRADGDYVQIINAPGHTPGSACYLINGKILVTGDLLRISSGGEILPFVGFINMDRRENVTALEKLKKEGIIDKAEWILSGHSGFKKNG